MKKITTFFCSIAVFLLFAGLNSSSFAQSNNATASGQFSVQGMLTSNTGTPITDGQHSITANVYANGSATPVFTQTQNVTTVNGMFTAMIGSNGGSNLNVHAGTDYQLGISVDNGTELSPKLSLASSLNSLTANLAANADSVGGFAVSANAGTKANTLLVLNNSGKIDSSLLSGSIVSSVNGMTGPINIQGGGNLGVTTTGNTVNLSFTGSGSGGLNLPFSQTLNLASGTGLSISNTLGGSAATFTNTGVGAALNATATTGSAITASTTGSANGAATLDLSNTGGVALNAISTSGTGAVMTLKNLSSSASAQLISAANSAGTPVLDVLANGQTTINSSVSNALSVTSSGGTAINATANTSSDAALKVQNLSTGSGANLMTALNSTGTAVLTVAGNGQTTINSTVGNALNVSTTASGEAALALNGGLKITGGAAGTGTIALGQLQTTITNALVKSNSIILVTVNAAGAAAVPLQVASQGNGSFVVSAITSLAGLTGAVNFSYLIISQ